MQRPRAILDVSPVRPQYGRPIPPAFDNISGAIIGKHESDFGAEVRKRIGYREAAHDMPP